MDLDKYMDSVFLPPDIVLMVEKVCVVGENRTVQSWWGQVWDADGD